MDSSQQDIFNSLPPQVQSVFGMEPEAFGPALQAALATLEPDEGQRVLQLLVDNGFIQTNVPADIQAVLNDFEPLLRAIAAATLGHVSARAQVTQLLPDLEEKGWHLSAAVERLWEGERDLAAIQEGLDAPEQAMLARVLALLEDESLHAAVASEDQGPSHALDPLLRDVALVALGEEGLREEIEAFLPELEARGWRLADPVHAIWGGERDLNTLTAGLDEQDAAMVARILYLMDHPEALSPLDGDDDELEALLAGFEPLIADVRLALGGDDEARARLEGQLEALEEEGTHLGTPIRQLLEGEQDVAVLLADLGEEEELIMRRVLSRLTAPAE